MSSRLRTVRRTLPGLVAASLPLEPAWPLLLLLEPCGAALDAADRPEAVAPPLSPPQPAIKAATEIAIRVRRKEEEEEEEEERFGGIGGQVCEDVNAL
jgi:hypothetical protein